MPRLDVTSRWEELAPDIEDRRRRLIVIAAEYRVSWTAALSQAVRLELITRAELDCFDVNRPTRPDYIELGVRFQTELDPMSLPLSFEQAAFRAYRRSLVTSDRLVELLRQTVAVDDLPPPFDTPIESLDAEFESLT